jgi:hypothetical protein
VKKIGLIVLVLVVTGLGAWRFWPRSALPQEAEADLVVVHKADHRLELYREGALLKLRAAMIEAKIPHLVQGEPEYWFAHNDGRIMRCTLHPQFAPAGAPGICGAFTNVFVPSSGGWTVESSPLITCSSRAK